MLQLSAAGVTTVAVPVTTARPATTRAATEQTYRCQYHFTVPEQWKNDPQRPIRINGQLHYYYLYNADYLSDGGGTAWRLATTTDNVVFRDEGISIPKFTTPNGDVWSGSVVVDTDNTAGFGEGSVIVLATQPDGQNGGAQAQFLWYSTDGGFTFTNHGKDPVMPNPGVSNFRDPKIIRDSDRGRWVTLLAEGNKVGFYVSQDLKNWNYVSGFIKNGLGPLECPDLFHLTSSDGSATWVLGVSADGGDAGLPKTFAYWTGHFDGTTFHPDASAPQWLDHGFDWYAAVTWEKPAGDGVDPTTRYAMAWMNNWDYAHNTPTTEADGYNGVDSIVREITLREQSSGQLSLVSRPVDALYDRVARTIDLGTITVDGEHPLPFQGVAYEIRAEVTWGMLENVGMQLRKSSDGSRHIDLGVFGDYAYLNRAATGHPDQSGQWLESHTPFDPAAKRVDLRALVDRTTIELFLDDGRYVHSHLVFPDPTDTGVTLFTVGGAAVFSSVVIREFDPIRPPEKPLP
nr:GH32 C-terminal domain-containing protein [Actinopolyspora biskrensis]